MAGPLVAPLILGGLGAATSLFGAWKGANGQKQAGQHLAGMERRAGMGLHGANQRADESRNRYQSAIEGYDPEAFANRALTGQLGQLNRGLDSAFMNNNAQLNRRGLLRSPIGNDRILQDFNSQLSNAVNSTAMQYGQMAGNRANMFGQFAGMDQSQANMYQNALWGLGSARAGAMAGQGDAWAQALGGIGGGLMGLGGAIYGG